jgi:hypothetical protein
VVEHDRQTLEVTMVQGERTVGGIFACVNAKAETKLRGYISMDVTSCVGARSESRTRTPLRAVDFESTASTNSAIRA